MWQGNNDKRQGMLMTNDKDTYLLIDEKTGEIIERFSHKCNAEDEKEEYEGFKKTKIIKKKNGK